MCTKVSVKADYDFFKGSMDCWTDINGKEHCPEITESNDADCEEFENNPQCGFISSECIDGTMGSSGTCYAFKERYDCGSDVAIPTLEKDTQYQCGGPIKCMGR